MSKDTHIILLRPREATAWQKIAYATSVKSAATKLSKLTRVFTHGDLVTVVKIEEVSMIPESATELYFANRHGVLTKVPPYPYGESTWLIHWEGPMAHAWAMFTECNKVEKPARVLAGCACARLTLAHADKYSGAILNCIEAAERHALKIGSAAIVKEAARAAGSVAADIYVGRGMQMAAYAAKEAAKGTRYATSYASAAMGELYGTGNAEAMLTMAHLVRERIPLYMMLESQT